MRAQARKWNKKNRDRINASRHNISLEEYLKLIKKSKRKVRIMS